MRARHFDSTKSFLTLALLCLFFITGCGGGGADSDTSTVSSSVSTPGATPTIVQPPTVGGSPADPSGPQGTEVPSTQPSTGDTPVTGTPDIPLYAPEPSSPTDDSPISPSNDGDYAPSQPVSVPTQTVPTQPAPTPPTANPTPTTDPTPPKQPANIAPAISGQAPSSVEVSTSYSFNPIASDANGDTLTFKILNKPKWAVFSTTTGRLSGVPQLEDIGNYSNVQISVTDGKLTTTLTGFSIAVVASTAGTATLSWEAPLQNTDGSALTDLSGYNIVYGTNPSALAKSILVNNPGLTTYVISSLPAGTYYFAIQALTSAGAQSALSNIVSKVVH